LGGGGVRVGVTGDAGEFLDIDATELSRRKLDAAGGADTRGRDLSVGSMGSESTSR
jgi:hypothetical protein